MRVVVAVVTIGLAVSCSAGDVERDRFDDDGGTGAGTAGPGGAPGTGGVINPTMAGSGAGSVGGDPTSSSSMSSTSSSMPCPDSGPEPNDTMGAATFLGAIDDCDSSGLSFSGVLGNNDVDWFSYEASDVSFCAVNPTRTITADGQVRVCKYPVCVTGTESFTCPQGSSPDSSNGMSGCCSTTEVGFDFNCEGPISDDATVYLRIDKPSGFSCVNYSVTLHY